MKRRWIIGVFLGILMISGCRNSGQPDAATIAAPVKPTAVKAETVKPTDVPEATAQQSAASSAQSVKPTATGPGCTVVSSLPTPVPELVTLFSPQKDDWSRGPEDAAVTIVEYSDFQCPFCAGFADSIKRVEQDFPDDVRLVFRHFPLDSIHDKAILAAQAAEAAGKQDKFWEMHDYLFGHRNEWVSLSKEDFGKWLTDKMPKFLDLDAQQFEKDLTSKKIADVARKAWDHGKEIGLPGTPFLVINNIPYKGPSDVANLERIVEMIKLEPKQFTECPPMAIDPLKQYIATIKTEKGNIVLSLYADKAPIAVNSFIFLAKHGWYDGVTFHRVIPGFVAQAGDPTGTGMGGPGYAFVNETSPDLKFDRAGLLAMANAGPNSNGSQFFITYDAAPNLDGGYTIFGEVTDGMDVVRKLTPRDPSKGQPLDPGDRIVTITIEEK